MARRVDVVLSEMLVAIKGIENALADETRSSFLKSWFLQRGTERGLEIISEAARHIPDELLASQPQIPWSDIRTIGNIIRHEYHRVDPDVIWSVATDDLPALKAAVEAMVKGAKG
ncbi:MAG: HepT-like ribonuclease domain-containing protein [Beijerinckiaceae bacterium]